MGSNPRLIHYRRCHVCGAVTESFQKIERCECCGKHVAPFFYFDDLATTPPSDSGVDGRKTEPGIKPLLGLTAYWTSKSSSGPLG